MSAMVKDVMTTEVVAVRQETTFKEMAAVLRRYRVSALPVVDDAGRVLGVVSEADLLAKEALADPGPVAELVHRKDLRKAEGLTAGDLMTRPPVTATPDDPVEQAPLAPGLPLPAGPQGPSAILGIGPCTGGVVRHPPRFLPTRSWDAGVPLRDPWAAGQMSLRMSRERRWVVGQMPQPTELGSRHTAA
jgi:hypothetical protein